MRARVWIVDALQKRWNISKSSSMSEGSILIVAPSAYPVGGVATWIDYIVPGLRQRGWRVTLGLTQGLHHNVDAYLSDHPMEGVIRVRNMTGTREGRVRALCDAITEVRPDIVSSVNIVDVYRAVNRLKRRGSLSVRGVMTLHGLDGEYYEQIRHEVASLDAVIATNRLACKLASSVGGLESGRIYYAPYGVRLPKSFGIAPIEGLAPIRIGFVGRLEKPQKRIDDLVAIVREMDRQKINYQLLIAGAGPEENWLRCELRLNVERGVVQFLGALSRKEVEDFYGTIHTLLITSSWETGPIVAWEAMARGVLVVTSAYIGSGLEGNLRHRENCLIYPVGNAAAAVKCIVKTDVELRSRLTSAGIEFVRERMTHERSIEYWSQCFTDIRSLPARPPSVEHTRREPAGRLDRLLGTRLGEIVRKIPYRKRVPVEPGEEWPHISVASQIAKETFWELTRIADFGDAEVFHTGKINSAVH
jgi:glycosyltransferase involved in cell wall biosynthesis